MKARFLFYLAMVLTAWRGYTANALVNADTKVFNYSVSDSSVADRVVITKLGANFSIRTTADSWLALVRRVQPTFAWNGCDLMWVNDETNGQPRFILDEAYLYQPTNQPLRWVLLKDEGASLAPDDSRVQSPRFFYSGRNLRAVAVLHDTKPSPNDGGYYGSYAVTESANPRFGVVYEIGWQNEMGMGNAHPICSRRIYLFKDKTDRWHFLGEGPEEGSERGDWQTVQARVVWNTAASDKLPLKIQFVCKDEECGYGEDDPRTNCYVTYNESVLIGPFPAKLRSTLKHPYIHAEKGDTFDTIVSRCAEWCPNWGYDPENTHDRKIRQDVDTVWRAGVSELNPQLPLHGNIKAGTHIQVLTYAEVADRLEMVEEAERR